MSDSSTRETEALCEHGDCAWQDGCTRAKCPVITTVTGDPWHGCSLLSGHSGEHDFSVRLYGAYPEFGIEAPPVGVPTQAEREALDADITRSRPIEWVQMWNELVHFTEVFRRERGYPANESARTEFLWAAGFRRQVCSVTEADVRAWFEFEALAGQIDNLERSGAAALPVFFARTRRIRDRAEAFRDATP